MTMHLGMGHSQRMEMRPSPSLIQFAEILQLSGLDLQQVIQQAVAENPALELAEADLCPACGDPLLPGGTCLRCRRGEDLAGEAARALVEPDSEAEAFDVLTSIADQRSLHEYLLSELAMVLDAADMPIAEYLVGELDDRGFLETSLDLAGHSLGVAPARVERVLAALQSVGPLGIGARSVEECLRLQLDRWAEAGVTCPLARELITEHLEALGRGQYAQLARQLGGSAEDVIAARDFIRTHLRPYPIAEETDLSPWDRQTGPGFIAPDVIVRYGKGDDDLEIEVIESRRYRLSISPMYRELVARLESGQAPRAGLSAREGAHIHSQVHQARQFLGHIRDRRETLHRVTAYVMARQTAFLRHGPRHLLPLTRAEVAEALALHESTISRATAGKYVLLPSQQVVAFSTFFKAALSVQDVLREIVAGEPHPLTDTELAEALAARGYPIARRTVAKYREQMGILPSSLR